MKPWETYDADLTIDLKKHHVPTTFSDKLAYWTVKSVRFPTDVFFQVFYQFFTFLLSLIFLFFASFLAFIVMFSHHYFVIT